MTDRTDSPLALAFVGDVALGNHPKTPGFGFLATYPDGIPADLTGRIAPADTALDMLIGNLEFVLTPQDLPDGDERCCLGRTGYIEFLKQAGFTVLNMANNHVWEFGPDLFWRTVSALQDAGIKVVGIPADHDPNGFLRIKGKKVAVLGCSARPRQGFTTAPGYNEYARPVFLERIAAARRDADLVCVSIHWGEEFIAIPSPAEREAAREMIDRGADVVVGHHPHVLREIEHYGNGLIAYSLGNFIGDMIWNPLTRESGCLVVTQEGAQSLGARFHPAVIADDFFPRYLSAQERREYLAEQAQRHHGLARDLETMNYAAMVKAALRRHQALTARFLLRNIHRYKFATLMRILDHGLRSRIAKKNKRHASHDIL